MNLEVLRKIIKEEISKTLNEDTFHNGETVLHMGQRFTVVSDEGNVGVRVQTKDGKIKMIMRSQLSRPVKEVDSDKPRYNVSGMKESSISGTLNILSGEPSLISNREVQKAFMNALKSLDLAVLNRLNTEVQFYSSKTFPSAQGSDAAKKAEIDILRKKGYSTD